MYEKGALRGVLFKHEDLSLKLGILIKKKKTLGSRDRYIVRVCQAVSLTKQ